MNPTPGKYIIELAELGNAVKQLILEGVVREKVGDAGCRLYRLLLRRHANGGCSARGQQKLELKQLAEMTLMPEREARPLLLQLLQSEFVLLQEVPRSSDRNTKTTTYVWYVSLQHAYRTVENALLHTLVNLHRRLRYERKALHGAVLPATICSAPSLAPTREEDGGVPVFLSSRTPCKLAMIENSILQLHETLMVLRTA